VTTFNCSKPLAEIPRDVYLSALQLRPGIVGEAFRAVRNCAGPTLVLVVVCAPLALITWGLAAFAADPGRLRLGTTIFFAALFALCVGYHCLELLMAVPWRDRAYPVLLNQSEVYHLLARSGHGWSLSATTAIYAALLWLAWWRGWQQTSGAKNTLAYAVVNTALAIAMFLYGRYQPYGAFRAPMRQDRQWLASQSPSALVAGQVSVSASPEAAHAARQADYVTPVSARAARLSFAHIFGMQAVKEKLLEPARAIISGEGTEDEPPANGILLHGAPGNGKTVFAEALAGELGVPIVTLTYGATASKWLGEMPRLISNCFTYAKANAPCVFFIDEIDSFLRSREFGSSNSEDLKIVNTLLTEIAAVRDHRVVLVGATNYLAGLDPAAVREGRFDLKVEITAPDEPARIGILRCSAAKYAADLHVDSEALLCVARRWNGFSVSRLVAICKSLAKAARERQSTLIGLEQWGDALKLVQGNNRQPPAGSKRLCDFVLEHRTTQALQLVVDRLRDAHRIESLGGTLPSGILLHGPSGTGKTAAAHALALESGWAFLSVAGPDLLADRDKLNRLYAQAADLRPAIIFIDEADDVLANRRFAAVPEVVNRMLALMDGAGQKVSDVVLVAATNHPDLVDPALLRGGRFTEKIEFAAPPPRQMVFVVRSWLQSKQVRLEFGIEAADLALVIGSQTVANAHGVLQYGLNCAIARTSAGEKVTLRRSDVCTGLRAVCGIGCSVATEDHAA
jgi:transitional endoplasmic reticulum ATPase